jgi:hypothetical protein
LRDIQNMGHVVSDGVEKLASESAFEVPWLCAPEDSTELMVLALEAPDRLRG